LRKKAFEQRFVPSSCSWAIPSPGLASKEMRGRSAAEPFAYLMREREVKGMKIIVVEEIEKKDELMTEGAHGATTI